MAVKILAGSLLILCDRNDNELIDDVKTNPDNLNKLSAAKCHYKYKIYK